MILNYKYIILMKAEEYIKVWAATYGEKEDDIRASMYSPEMIIEFAEAYHKSEVKKSKVTKAAKKLYNNMIFSESNYYKKVDAISIINDKIKFLRGVKQKIRKL